jgi:hypothetical protein
VSNFIVLQNQKKVRKIRNFSSEKTINYPEFEPRTSGLAVGSLNTAPLGWFCYKYLLTSLCGTTTIIWLRPIEEDFSMSACLEHSASNLWPLGPGYHYSPPHPPIQISVFVDFSSHWVWLWIELFVVFWSCDQHSAICLFSWHLGHSSFQTLYRVRGFISPGNAEWLRSRGVKSDRIEFWRRLCMSRTRGNSLDSFNNRSHASCLGVFRYFSAPSISSRLGKPMSTTSSLKSTIRVGCSNSEPSYKCSSKCSFYLASTWFLLVLGSTHKRIE